MLRFSAGQVGLRRLQAVACSFGVTSTLSPWDCMIRSLSLSLSLSLYPAMSMPTFLVMAGSACKPDLSI